MLFNSAQYLFFYLAVLIASWLLVGKPVIRIWLILLASFYFYASNNGWLILLLFICMQIDYWAAKKIEQSNSPKIRKTLLAISMTANLGMLAFFKYFNFFCSSCTDFLNIFGVHSSWSAWQILLPVGISFYTFESMSYTIDVYRGLIPAEKYWHRFAFFVAYFPHLIAGPILRPKQFLPQLDKKPSLNKAEFEQALFTIVKGLFKKVVLADYLAIYADAAFNKPAEIGALAAWLGVFAFTFQIYYDFSGYTDIAIGCAKLMGFQIPDNFLRPYASSSITNFWRRWHISLSTWLRDYLYIPLGGNRMKTKIGVYRNLMITMLLGGLWHGAAWHFVIWGGLQGLFLTAEKICGVEAPKKMPTLSFALLSAQALTFVLATFSWSVFRATNLSSWWQIMNALFDFSKPNTLTTGMLAAVSIIVSGWLIQLISEYWDPEKVILKLPIFIKGFAYALASVAIIVLSSEGAKTFIYFQF